MSLLVRSTMTPVRRKKASDSDTETQIVEEPLRRLRRQLPLPRGAMLHYASNRLGYEIIC